MKYIHLDSEFRPLGKGIEYEKFVFNGGEPHVKIMESIQEGEAVTITQRVSSFTDLGFVLMAKDALDRMGAGDVHLVCPYFPAARQDRVMVPGEALSCKVYANLLNQANFKSVTIFDSHSDVSPALIDRCANISNHAFVKEVLKEMKDYLLIAPDGGALKKVYKLGSYLEVSIIVECSKVREVSTGKLSGFKVNAADLEGKSCVIVDDICDGGGTFLGLAQELKAKGAGTLFLVVSHGIFSRGSEALSEVFDKIYTTDSFSTIDDKNITQFKLDSSLLK